jgi:hypothetical protein
MFRIIKRSPWIVIGAAGAWLFDPVSGPQRRAMLTSKARDWKDELTSSRPTTATTPPSFGSTGGVGDDYADPTLAQRSA